MFNSFIVKLTNACDLACPYCYYMVDAPTKGQHIFDDVLNNLFLKITEYCSTERQLHFYWHGGEPLLIGKERFRRIIEKQQTILASHKVINGLQTNGVKLDEEWIELFNQLGIGLGISLDGTAATHDTYRVDHKGHGTYAKIVANARLAIRSGLDPICLVVVNPDEDGAIALENVVSIGFKRLDFLLPMSNWDSYNEREAVKCGTYVINAFRAWLRLGDPQINVKLFHSMIKVVTEQVPGCCMFHNSCDNTLTVEPNGDIALCDDLKPVGGHVYRTGLNIVNNDLHTIRKEIGARFRKYSINSAHTTREPKDIARNWCPATRYSSSAGFMKNSVDSIPIGMLQDEVMRSLGTIGIDTFRLHRQMLTQQ